MLDWRCRAAVCVFLAGCQSSPEVGSSDPGQGAFVPVTNTGDGGPQSDPGALDASAGGEDAGDGASDGEVGQGPVSETCASSAQCGAGSVCAGDVCVPAEGSCSGDGDCPGDTYCCAADCIADGEDPTCVPYGVGPRGMVSDQCQGEVTIGLFEPSVQCAWTGPPDRDDFPDHVQVLATPMVADLPHDSGASAEILIVTYNFTDGGDAAAAGSDPQYFGVLRVLNGQTCEQLETIDDPEHRAIAASPPALADLDGDGDMEIVTHRAGGGLVAFHWDDATASYTRLWAAEATDLVGVNRWDGPAIHDLNDDGLAEVISGGEVYAGHDGARLNPGQSFYRGKGALAVLGDVDADGQIELVDEDVRRWDPVSQSWVFAHEGTQGGSHWAFADFGTAGATAADFDPTRLDGVAEIVATGAGVVRIATLNGDSVLDVAVPDGGGPPTIGDFDSDGFPEVASAGGTAYRVFDLDCAGAPAGCEGEMLRWSQPSQDASSRNTGSSIFDFEGDGKAEAVYADECFTRIYEGDTGEVLYSAHRSSCTWYENPVIADPDRDSNTEILVGSNFNCDTRCPAGAGTAPYTDPIHGGVRCENDSECVSGSCVQGLCRCEDAAGCREGFACEAAPGDADGNGNVCRAQHPGSAAQAGLVVLRDRLDRWASSRPMWNQHAYSVTNILDDGSVPSSSAWLPNFQQDDLNNYRQNVQGPTSSQDLPDITGRLDQDAVCRLSGDTTTLTATVCNRGKRAVGAAMPATFYLGEGDDRQVLCVSYTEGPVPVGGCLDVSCTLNDQATGMVTMVVNDDGEGGRTAVECLEDNNSDSVQVDSCPII